MGNIFETVMLILFYPVIWLTLVIMLTVWASRQRRDGMSKIKLTKRGDIDLNEFTKRVTLAEGGAKQVSIAQIKEISKQTAMELVRIHKEFDAEKMLRTVYRLARRFSEEE
ncbi:MAG: hypothetical protein ABH851_07505 [Methanobacteriota archaeon]